HELAQHHLGVHVAPEAVAGLARYQALLLDWNQQMNLTAITDPAAIAVRHFLDSLSVLTLPNLPAQARLIDLGTGAGLPGIPLAIMRPAWRVHLVDATGKKITFLRTVINALGLQNASAEQARAETLGQAGDYRATYDLVTARAVAHLPVLAEYMLPLCAEDGLCIALKGDTAHTEKDDAAQALRILGGEIERIARVDLPGVEMPHYLVCIRKVAPTPAMYPRRDGVPRKNPL
ncbi:MAG: 16S rRNA (guanine(527)-N(7))-methyltransferase RsmG, partial [Anaerolineales bacterium]